MPPRRRAGIPRRGLSGLTLHQSLCLHLMGWPGPPSPWELEHFDTLHVRGDRRFGGWRTLQEVRTAWSYARGELLALWRGGSSTSAPWAVYAFERHRGETSIEACHRLGLVHVTEPARFEKPAPAPAPAAAKPRTNPRSGARARDGGTLL